MEKPTSATETTLPNHRLEIFEDAHKRTWWSEHKAPYWLPEKSKVVWGTLATIVHDHADCEASAFRDACLAHGLNPETGLHPSGQAFDIFIQGDRATGFPIKN